MDRIRIGYPAGYLRFFRIRIGFGYLILKKIGTGYLFDFYNEISMKVIQDVINNGGSVFFAMDFIFTKKSKLFFQYVVHSSQSIYVALSVLFPGEVEVVSCSYNAGMPLSCGE